MTPDTAWTAGALGASLPALVSGLADGLRCCLVVVGAGRCHQRTWPCSAGGVGPQPSRWPAGRAVPAMPSNWLRDQRPGVVIAPARAPAAHGPAPRLWWPVARFRRRRSSKRTSRPPACGAVRSGWTAAPAKWPNGAGCASRWPSVEAAPAPPWGLPTTRQTAIAEAAAKPSEPLRASIPATRPSRACGNGSRYRPHPLPTRPSSTAD